MDNEYKKNSLQEDDLPVVFLLEMAFIIYMEMCKICYIKRTWSVMTRNGPSSKRFSRTPKMNPSHTCSSFNERTSIPPVQCKRVQAVLAI